MLNQILRPIARRALQRGTQTRMAHQDNYKYVTFDEACVPQGSWKENYQKKQKKYNAQLIAGIASFVLSCVAINSMELIYFNYSPPTPDK